MSTENFFFLIMAQTILESRLVSDSSKTELGPSKRHNLPILSIEFRIFVTTHGTRSRIIEIHFTMFQNVNFNYFNI